MQSGGYFLMSEFKSEDLDVIRTADTSTVQLLALQLKKTMAERDVATQANDHLEVINRALVAENAELKNAVTAKNDLLKRIRESGRPPHTDYWHQSLWEADERINNALNTPATDAFLNALQAEGVEMYASALKRKYDGVRYDLIGNYDTNGEEDKISDYGEIDSATTFAAQLRAGDADKAGE
jgi:hypothetical protein